MRRTHRRGRKNVFKRLLIHVAGFNLSLVLRQQLGAGTPPGLTAAKTALQRLGERLFGVLTPRGWTRHHFLCPMAPRALRIKPPDPLPLAA